jgi:hypothetical protein
LDKPTKGKQYYDEEGKFKWEAESSNDDEDDESSESESEDEQDLVEQDPNEEDSLWSEGHEEQA